MIILFCRGETVKQAMHSRVSLDTNYVYQSALPPVNCWVGLTGRARVTCVDRAFPDCEAGL